MDVKSVGTEFRTAAEVVSKYKTKLKSGIVEIYNYELKSGNYSQCKCKSWQYKHNTSYRNWDVRMQFFV